MLLKYKKVQNLGKFLGSGLINSPSSNLIPFGTTDMNMADMVKAIYDDSYVRKEYLFLSGIDETKIKWSGTFTNTSNCLYIYNTSPSPSYAYSEEIDFTDINAIYSYCMFYAVNGGNITFYVEVVKESDKLNMDTAVDLVYGIYNANATGYGGSITFDTSKITGKLL